MQEQKEKRSDWGLEYQSGLVKGNGNYHLQR